jgi:excisionase family DNA binding protein
MNIMDYFYTEQEAAKLLGVNPITIWRWVKAGKLDLQHVGREALIPKWEIEVLRAFREQETHHPVNRKRRKVFRL